MSSKAILAYACKPVNILEENVIS